MTVTTHLGKYFLKMKNSTIVTIFRLFSTISILIEFYNVGEVRFNVSNKVFFYYSTQMLSYNTRFASSRNFFVNSLLQVETIKIFVYILCQIMEQHLS